MLRLCPKILLIALVTVLNLSACSPGSLFGGGQNNSVLQTPTYHQVNRNCTGLDLSVSQFSAKVLRDLVTCFNTYHAMDPIQNLMNKMSDQQVGAFADVLNQNLLQNPSLLYDFEKSFYQETQDGTFKTSLQSLSQLLDNPVFVNNVFTVLDASDADSKQKILNILQAVGSNLGPAQADQALSTLSLINSSKAFHSLLSNLASSDANSAYSLQDLTQKAVSLLIEAKQPGFSFINAVNESIQNGDFLPALDQVFGSDANSISAKIPSVSQLFPVLYANDGEMRNGIGAMYKDLESPISCVENSLSVPDPIQDVYDQIAATPPGGAANYMRREHALRTEAVEPFCALPASLKQNFIEFQKLADSTAIGAVEDIVRSADQDKKGTNYPLINLIEGYLTDPKTAELTPFVTELTHRDAWPDLMLLIAEVGEANRARLTNALNFYVTNVKDPLSDILIAAGPDKAYAIVSQITTYMRRHQYWFLPVATGFRKSLNDGPAHPDITLLQNLLSQAPQNAYFFQTLFSLSELPEFQPTVALLSTMAVDGRLQEIISDWVVILHSTAVRGAHSYPPLTGGTLAQDSPLRADFAQSDLAQAQAPPQLANSSCEQINFNIAPDQQWSTLTSCLSSNGGFSDVQSLFTTLESNTTESGQTEIQFMESWISDFSQVMTPPQIASLVQSWTLSVDRGDFTHLLGAAGTLISDKVLQPLLQLAQPFASAGPARQSLDALEAFISPVVRSSSLPSMATELDQASQKQETPPASYVNPGHDTARIERWIKNKECEKFKAGQDPEPGLLFRTQQIIQDYEEGVDVVDATDGAARLNWTIDDLKTLTNPILAKLADPAQSDPSHPLQQSILNFIADFSLQPGQAPNATQHFSATDLEKWFYDRATDQQLVTYYYLGEPPQQTPQVRLLSSLDRLQLILSNADFDTLAPILDKLGVNIGVNIGKYSEAQIGDSWGDEPEALWPPEIKRKYALTSPPKLQDTVNNIKGLLEYLKDAMGYPAIPQCSQQTDPNDPASVQTAELSDSPPTCKSSSYAAAHKDFGLPDLPGCIDLPDTSDFDLWDLKRRIYNIAQVVSVLDENLPASGTPQAGGLKLLRDLFYQINYSTPEQNRGQTAGNKNNLSIVRYLVQSGICRQISFVMRRYQENDPALVGFFQTVVSLARSPSAPGLLNRLVNQDSSRTLIWNIAQSLFPYMGNPLSFGQVKPSGGQDALDFVQSMINGGSLIGQWGLADASVQSINKTFDEHRDELTNRIGDALPLLAPKSVSSMIRALFEDAHQSPSSAGATAIQEVAESFLQNPENLSNLAAIAQAIDINPQAKSSFAQFESLWANFQASPTYQNLELATIDREMLGYFEEKPGTDPTQIATERALREYFARRIDSGDADQMIHLLGSNPDQAERALETVGNYISNGDINSFFMYIRQSLEQN